MREKGGKKLNILVCDDDKEIVEAIEIYLQQEGYQVFRAYDGEDALKILKEEEIHLLIIDVMMPKLDGIRATLKIREESSIPIIILSAKSEDTDKILGLNVGADDYITKPFSATYLKARVRNILERRKKLQEMYREKLMNIVTSPDEPTVEESKAPEMSPNDRKFMDKLMALMEKNLDNGDLIVDDLVKDMAVSRSVFFKKLKSLTGLAPVEFIKEMRINRAVQLIETGEYSMTQIAYMVGINDPRYFSKCFKQKMGMTPTEYRDRKAGKN